MSIDAAFQGSLFASEFLYDTVAGSTDWQEFEDAALEMIETELRAIFDDFPVAGSPNESQTEDDLIWPVLAALGWSASLRQQNLSATGREDVPDGLLFADDAAKVRANGLAREWMRYEIGLAVVESKRWLRPLDRRSGRAGEETAPSTQMLRYLRRVDDLMTGALRWGILTNGARWRLYYQGAQSVSEQFFEADLPAILDIPGHNEGLFALDGAERRHALRLFALVFRREAFLPGAADERTFHRRAIEEGRFYEERVAASLSDLVFGQVFPELARAIAAAAPDAPLTEVREAALILLYRLLFILYAEDRDLLPVRDERYDDYALRDKVRGDVGRRKDVGDVFSKTQARYWSAVDDLCRAVDRGDASIGLPPYNGGLFDRARVPLLDRIRLGDRAMADVIDALSFECDNAGRRRYINYRDLGVRQLGSIYERLLEHEVVRKGGDVAVRPNIFARKGSGSYYTPDDLVGLIVEETVGSLVSARTRAFEAEAAKLPVSGPDREGAVSLLAEHDPAEAVLALRVCDPAMGSGHFLVTLVDYLADRVIAAMAEAEAAVDGYVSPLGSRIQGIRDRIVANAEERSWAIDLDRLDDRHIVRRMVLKRCVYGVDKNPMAVELAKVALWLHTFTVGVPLSFLDHHLRCGDSLFGASARAAIDKAAGYGGPLLLHGSIAQAERSVESMQRIEDLTDAEIAEAHLSAEAFAEVEEETGPLDTILSLVHAADWLKVRDREGTTALQSFFGGLLGDPIEIALGREDVSMDGSGSARFVELLDEMHRLIGEERFLHWQTAFPGVWTGWQSADPEGGFDAVIGNPPWDRMKLQQVEWFASRRREIALATRAADRKRMIAALERDGDPLARDYEVAAERAAMAARVARRRRRVSLALLRRREPLLALRRTRDGAGQARRHDRTPHALRHRVGQDGVAFLQGRRNRRTAEGALRLREPANAPRVVALLSRCRQPFQVLCLRRQPDPGLGNRALCFLSSARRGDRRSRAMFSVDGGGLRARQPEHRNRADIPNPSRCRADRRDLRASAGAGGPLVGRRGQGLAGEIHAYVRHDQRLRSVPHARGARGAGGRVLHRRQPVRQPGGRVGAAVRRQDGAGVRSPRRQCRRQSGEPAPSGPTPADNARSASESGVAARSAILGAAK